MKRTSDSSSSQSFRIHFPSEGRELKVGQQDNVLGLRKRKEQLWSPAVATSKVWEPSARSLRGGRREDTLPRLSAPGWGLHSVAGSNVPTLPKGTAGTAARPDTHSRLSPLPPRSLRGKPQGRAGSGCGPGAPARPVPLYLQLSYCEGRWQQHRLERAEQQLLCKIIQQQS